MKELKEHVENFISFINSVQGQQRNDIETLTWELIEHAMRVQQEICGGHKR